MLRDLPLTKRSGFRRNDACGPSASASTVKVGADREASADASGPRSPRTRRRCRRARARLLRSRQLLRVERQCQAWINRRGCHGALDLLLPWRHGIERARARCWVSRPGTSTGANDLTGREAVDTNHTRPRRDHDDNHAAEHHSLAARGPGSRNRPDEVRIHLVKSARATRA